jgi:hypothetical protein
MIYMKRNYETTCILHHFLDSILKDITQIPSNSFCPNQLNFTVFRISTLPRSRSTEKYRWQIYQQYIHPSIQTPVMSALWTLLVERDAIRHLIRICVIHRFSPHTNSSPSALCPHCCRNSSKLSIAFDSALASLHYLNSSNKQASANGRSRSRYFGFGHGRFGLVARRRPPQCVCPLHRRLRQGTRDCHPTVIFFVSRSLTRVLSMLVKNLHILVAKFVEVLMHFEQFCCCCIFACALLWKAGLVLDVDVFECSILP